MALLASSMNYCCWWRTRTRTRTTTTTTTTYISPTFVYSRIFTFTGGKFSGSIYSPELTAPKIYCGFAARTRTFASGNSARKLRRQKEARKIVISPPNKNPLDEYDGLEDTSTSGDDYVEDKNKEPSFEKLESQASIAIPSRSAVLQACTVTSGLIGALGILIREVSHIASVEGLPVPDCSAEISFSFEMWHLQLITGLAILISSCRYFLLKTWPDFAKSSEAANQQVLTSLQPLDYVVVSFMPGLSEELLFRGALLPLFGVNWKSALVVATLFGVLHLGSGRKYSFAIWATFVGFAYGYATIVSSSAIVPMASHALNNLVGGVLWSYTSKSSK